MPSVFRFIGFATLACASLFVQAQPLPFPLTAMPPGMPALRIDGALDDAAWSVAKPYTDFRRWRPDVQRDVGGYRTEVRVIAEPGALVFGIRCWDPAPSEIRAPLTRRDQITPEQDAVTVWLDPTGRSELAQFVRVNAAGSVSDGIYRASIDDEDTAPDFYDVEVATRRLPDGYSVEIRWPLSVLRYPLNGNLPWGLMVTRRVPRDQGMTFVSAPLERNAPHLLTQIQHFEDDAALRAQLNAEQHLRIRAETTARTTDDGMGQHATSVDLGMELQWRPRADWVVDAIVHPDFSQVELDEPQLTGNTRFALSQTEKRTFFLESSDVVGQLPPDMWGISRGLLAFYSRAVADPQWGVRATYRGNDGEATAMLLRDAGGGSVLRPNAFGTSNIEVDQPSSVLFARNRVQAGDGLALAGILSLRDWGAGAATQVAGMDGVFDLNQADQVRGHLLLSSDTTALPASADMPVQSVAAGPAQAGQAAWLSWQHRGDAWRWDTQLEHISPRFVNDNGFVPQSGIDRGTAELTKILHSDNPAISDWELYLRGLDTHAQADASSGVLRPQVASNLLQPGTWLMTSAGTEAYVYLNLDQARTHADGELHQAHSLLMGTTVRPGSRLTYLNLEATLGERLDVDADRVGKGYTLSSNLTWRETLGGTDLELNQLASIGRISAPDGSTGLDETNGQTKLVAYINAEQAVRLVYQRQAYTHSADASLLANAVDARVATLTWLARDGALRGWSVGTSWAQDLGQAARREVFVKFQQGWAWH